MCPGVKTVHLTGGEVKRFYTIWFPLLHYVNQQRKLLPAFPDQWGDASVDVQDAVILRDALWADDALREAFIAENPASLSADDLALVESWRYRVAGDFYVFRYLKKHTVFLSGESPMRAYGVLGLLSPIEEIVGPYLPILVNAVLSPFEGRIIYDSLLSPHSVYFGGGWRSSLRRLPPYPGARRHYHPPAAPCWDNDAVKVRKTFRPKIEKSLPRSRKH
jgi:hypothetical protein